MTAIMMQSERESKDALYLSKESRLPNQEKPRGFLYLGWEGREGGHVMLYAMQKAAALRHRVVKRL